MSIEAIPSANPTPNASTEGVGDHRNLATTLAPVLIEVCDGQLGPISWFKADWQHGGAATGTSTFGAGAAGGAAGGEDSGAAGAAPVVVKLPVVRQELLWLRRLQNPDDPEPVVPRLYASGEAIGGYDLTWVVMECFPYGPLGMHWNDNHVARTAEAAARWHQQAMEFAVDRPPRIEPWEAIVSESLTSVKVNKIAEPRRWNAALKDLRNRLGDLVTEWRARDTRQWLHGDLHFANAMSRRSLEEGPVSLIDLAEVHAGHWIEDAVYLERQLWASPDRLKATKPVRAVAAARRNLGLPVEPDYARLAMLRRALLAASAPKFIRSEGRPAHMQACLEWLERALKDI